MSQPEAEESPTHPEMFYLSRLVFVALIGAVQHLEATLSRGMLYAFGAAFALIILAWTRSYLNTCRVNEDLQVRIVDALRSVETPSSTFGTVDAYFSETISGCRSSRRSCSWPISCSRCLARRVVARAINWRLIPNG